MRVAVIIPLLYSRRFERIFPVIRSIENAGRGVVDTDIFLCVNGLPQRQHVRVPKGVHTLTSSVNKGFSQAVNDGIRFAGAAANPDWYLVLNDDVMLEPDFFSSLMSVLRGNTFDAVSCKVVTPTHAVESVGIRYGITGLTTHRKTDILPGDVPLFTGVCVLLSKKRVSREMHRHGYVFNPLFFAYAEDLELSLRIIADRGRIFISNAALVIHEGSRTAGRGSAFQLYYGYRNLMLVLFLYWPTSLMLRYLPALLVGQAYILAMSLYKGYWLLWPRIWWWILRHRTIIAWQRNQYAFR